MKHSQQLRRELQAAGAEASELSDLLRIASDLGRLQPAEASRSRLSNWRQLLNPLMIGAAGLLAGILLVITAQAVQPTNWLYPIQRLADNAAVRAHPPYRATVMMKRAQQVSSLVANHAGSQRVLATLADYTAQAQSYKATPHASYAAFEYCETTLQQAAAQAPSTERAAILRSLHSLQT